MALRLLAAPKRAPKKLRRKWIHPKARRKVVRCRMLMLSLSGQAKFSPTHQAEILGSRKRWTANGLRNR